MEAKLTPAQVAYLEKQGMPPVPVSEKDAKKRTVERAYAEHQRALEAARKRLDEAVQTATDEYNATCKRLNDSLNATLDANA